MKTPSPYCYRCPVGKTPADCSIDCADELEQALRRADGRVCAVILEPGVQAAAGMLTLPRGFLSRVAEACRTHGALLILDEVATGFGRTGTMFACQREGVTPDLLCVAKGLTGGYLPVAATLATDRVYDAFLGRYDEYRHFFHGHTYTGNALGCAAALATLGLLADGAHHRRGRAQGARAARGARAAVGASARRRDPPGGPDVRHRARGRSRDESDVRAGRSRTAITSASRLRDRGIFLRPLGDVIVLMPPLSSTDAELRHLAASRARGSSWSDSVRDLLVTGTDTGVGKTMIAAALVTALRARGVRALGFKPVETGVGGWRADGLDLLAPRLGRAERALARPLLQLAEPLAPAVAAERAGVTARSRRRSRLESDSCAATGTRWSSRGRAA